MHTHVQNIWKNHGFFPSCNKWNSAKVSSKKAWWCIISVESVTFTCSKPADANIFDKIKDVHGFLRCHYCFIRGAAVPPQIMQFFSSVGLPLFQSYGMTEGTTFLIVDFPHKRPGSIGCVVKGCNVRIHQPDKDGVGEVRCRKIWVSTACNLRFL